MVLEHGAMRGIPAHCHCPRVTTSAFPTIATPHELTLCRDDPADHQPAPPVAVARLLWAFLGQLTVGASGRRATSRTRWRTTGWRTAGWRPAGWSAEPSCPRGQRWSGPLPFNIRASARFRTASTHPVSPRNLIPIGLLFRAARVSGDVDGKIPVTPIVGAWRRNRGGDPPAKGPPTAPRSSGRSSDHGPPSGACVSGRSSGGWGSPLASTALL
jgi:hypothetical protein